MSRDLHQAQQLLDLGRPSEAEQMLRQLLVAEPQSAEALRLLAQALLRLDREPEALRVVDRAIALEPDEEHGHRVRAVVLVGLDRPLDAIREAREAVRLAPHLWQTHYTFGSSLRHASRPADALVAANMAVRLAPHESETHNLAGLCLDDLGRPDQAIVAWNEALRLDPQNAMALNNLAASEMERGKFSKASRKLTAALSSRPQEGVLHHNYDAILFGLIGRLYLALLALGVLLAVLAGTRAPYLTRVGTVVALLVIYGAVTWRVTRHLPRGAHLWARGLFGRSSRWRQVLLVAFALLTACVVVMGVAPREVALGTGVVVAAVLRTLGIIMIVVWIGRAFVNLFRGT